jgi:hypothetical protein
MPVREQMAGGGVGAGTIVDEHGIRCDLGVRSHQLHRLQLAEHGDHLRLRLAVGTMMTPGGRARERLA